MMIKKHCNKHIFLTIINCYVNKDLINISVIQEYFIESLALISNLWSLLVGIT